MRRSITERIDAAIDSYDKRQAAHREMIQNEIEKQKKRVADFLELKSSVIIPVLEEFRDELIARGYESQLIDNTDSNDARTWGSYQIFFRVVRNKFLTIHLESRQNFISIDANPLFDLKSCQLEDIDRRFVENIVAEFIEKVFDELPVSSTLDDQNMD